MTNLTHPSLLSIQPPLINSSNPWATTSQDLIRLYENPHTGAVTTRTSTLNVFEHHNDVHRYCFFDANLGWNIGETFSKGRVDEPPYQAGGDGGKHSSTTNLSSLNTLGYSPMSLDDYLVMIEKLVSQSSTAGQSKKLFIISVTGSSSEISVCYTRICAALLSNSDLHLAMEINLSCPNIHGRPPPAYEKDGLLEYLTAVKDTKTRQLDSRKFTTHNPPFSDTDDPTPRILPAVGIKTPPYTYSSQFSMLHSALVECSTDPLSRPIDFITATNTLGTSLVLSPPSTPSSDPVPALPSESGSGIGGLAGPALHPLALGNVQSIRRVLDSHESTKGIMVIGVGGVGDADGARRMRSVGAGVVGIGTALGVRGPRVFGEVVKGC